MGVGGSVGVSIQPEYNTGNVTGTCEFGFRGRSIGQASHCNNKVKNGLQLLVLGSVFLLVTWLQLYSATVESRACETDSAVT